ETESYLKASFYSGDETKILTAPDSLTIYGLSDTNKVYNKATKIEHALLPLNASTPECIFIIKINGTTDTVKFTYSSYPHLLSKECGYTFYHQLDTVRNFSKHIIKDIYSGNLTITTLNVENIRIFY
ncbi:MAG TPA: DUF6452 family protein, partial [Bacteroidales bacterium]